MITVTYDAYVAVEATLVIGEVVAGDGDGEQAPAIAFHVDDRDLRELAGAAERPFCEADGQPTLAGRYHWLTAAQVDAIMAWMEERGRQQSDEKLAKLRAPRPKARRPSSTSRPRAWRLWKGSCTSTKSTPSRFIRRRNRDTCTCR